MYSQDKPHGVATTCIPAVRSRIDPDSATIHVIESGASKMQLLNEALARARMRYMWRGRHRYKRDLLRALRSSSGRMPTRR